MDAREQLRRYLEQRREMGETELLLDRMTVEEAMRLLGGGGAPPKTGGPVASGPKSEAPIYPTPSTMPPSIATNLGPTFACHRPAITITIANTASSTEKMAWLCVAVKPNAPPCATGVVSA